MSYSASDFVQDIDIAALAYLGTNFNYPDDREGTEELADTIIRDMKKLRDEHRQLLRALKACKGSLEAWMEIQDEEDARDYDEQAIRLASKAIAKAEARYHRKKKGRGNV